MNLFLRFQRNGLEVRTLIKTNMKININYQLKIMRVFGEKKENA